MLILCLWPQWSLVCDRKYVPSTITTVQMCGLLVGALVCGQLADIFGRRKLLYITYTLLLAVSLGSSFVNSWQLFAAFRFFIGGLVGSKAAQHTHSHTKNTPAENFTYKISIIKNGSPAGLPRNLGLGNVQFPLFHLSLGLFVCHYYNGWWELFWILMIPDSG